MIPFSPFFGWYNHGFYNYNSTIYEDVARTNGYTLRALLAADFEPDGRRVRALVDVGDFQGLKAHVFDAENTSTAILVVAMTKGEDQPFVTPVQGYYDRPRNEPSSRPLSDAQNHVLSRYLESLDEDG